MGGKRLLVRWERHASGVLAHMRRLLAAEAFVDVTLCCQGRRLRAHRVLLSACSPYLQRILLENPCGAGESVTVILHDVSHEDMRRLLDLMYTGSTEVPGDDLSRFLCTAKALDVSLLRSAALQICEVATSAAEPDREPTPATTPAVPPSLPKTTPGSVVPSPKEPSLAHSQWPLMAPQLRGTDPAVHWQQAPHTGPAMLPLACRNPLTPSPPPTMVQSSNQAACEQEQLLRERHVCTPPPNVTFVSKSPGTASMSRHVQPKQQQERSSASPTYQHVQEEDSFLLRRLMGVVPTDKKTRPETKNINNTSRSGSGKPCGAKAVTSPQQLQQRQRVAPVEHQPLPLPPSSPPPLCVPPQQSDHLTPTVPPLPQSQPLPTAPSHSLSPSKIPAHFQEPKQPNPQQMQLPHRRRQQPRDLPESSQKPEDLPANPTLSCEAATEQQRKYECEDCSKLFVTKASLKVHALTHTGEKPYQCSECGKAFTQQRNYKYHMSVHAGTHEFAAACPECGKVFNNGGYLSSHMKIHRNRREYACTECGRRFNQRVAYTTHKRTHTGERPHACYLCDKAFTRKTLLNQHMRTHTGEKPFNCEVCGKRFADRSNMVLHQRLHSGIRPYSCGECAKAFTKKHHLKAHMSCHTGLRPYTCDRCGARFSQSSNMRTHRKKCTAPDPPSGGDGVEGGAGGGSGGPSARAAGASVIMRVSGELVQRVLHRTDDVAAASARNVTFTTDSAMSLAAPTATHTRKDGKAPLSNYNVSHTA